MHFMKVSLQKMSYQINVLCLYNSGKLSDDLLLKKKTPRLLRYIKQQPRRFIKGSIWLHLEETKEPSAFKATTCIITYPQK